VAAIAVAPAAARRVAAAMVAHRVAVAVVANRLNFSTHTRINPI